MVVEQCALKMRPCVTKRQLVVKSTAHLLRDCVDACPDSVVNLLPGMNTPCLVFEVGWRHGEQLAVLIVMMKEQQERKSRRRLN